MYTKGQGRSFQVFLFNLWLDSTADQSFFERMGLLILHEFCRIKLIFGVLTFELAELN